MKGIIGVASAALLFSLSASAISAQPGKLSDLSSSLSALRDTCANKAGTARAAFSTAQYKAGLDADLAVHRAQMDAQVYSVGHGRHETTEYLAYQLQAGHDKAEAESAKISEKMASDTREAEGCVSDAEQQGKSLYSAFKSSHKRKVDTSDAESLMTAWLTNLKEINVDHPNGSDATDAAWKTAKSHAEIADL